MKFHLLTLSFCLCSFMVNAQQGLIKPLIEAWSVNDTSQSRKFIEVNRRLNSQNDATRQLIIKNIHAYLNKHPNRRLQIRLMLLEEPWWTRWVHGNNDGRELIEKALWLARQEKDEQLIGDVYSAYAEFCTRASLNEEYLLYSAKAIEIRRKIGASHYPDFGSCLFNMCKALYITRDYKQSLQYGLECYQYDGKRGAYIFLLDLIGANCKELGLYDRSLYYYRLLVNTIQLENSKGNHNDFLQKWLVIANGNIGENLVLKKNIVAGMPLLKEYAIKSAQMVDQFNVGLANNAIANVYFNSHQYQLAISNWKKVYKWSTLPSVNNYEYALKAAEGISKGYYAIGLIDSAFLYSNLFHRHTDSLNAFTSRSNLRATQAKMAFETMQNNLERINLRLNQEKTIRNFILIGIVFLTLMSLLLYNRQRLKARYEAEILQRKRSAAEKEIKEAQENIRAFTSNIQEKDKLIKNLKQAIRQNSNASETEKLSMKSSLLNFVLVTDTEWIKFKDAFNKAHPLFFPRLNQGLVKINPAEERLACLICLHVNNMQIANMLGIGIDSVARSKRRLKKRFNLPDDHSLEDYILSLNE